MLAGLGEVTPVAALIYEMQEELLGFVHLDICVKVCHP